MANIYRRKRRLGRPPGPSAGRGARPWDAYAQRAINVVAANLDVPRYVIAERLGLSGSQLSNITCSPRGVAELKRLGQLPAEELAQYRLPVM